MSTLHKIVSYWDGNKPLHYIHHICLGSFVQKGHEVTLFTLAENRDRLKVPNGVSLQSVDDFREGISEKLRKTIPATASDFLRLMLVQERGDVWIDTDVYCVKPFEADRKYMFAHEGQEKLASKKDGNINNAVLALPTDSPASKLLKEYADTCLGYVKTPSEPVRWYIENGGGHPILKHGPRALTHFLDHTGEIDEQMHPKELYPIHFNLSDCYWDPDVDITQRFLSTTVATHIWDSQVRPGWYRREALEGSFMANAADALGVDMNKYRRRK